MTTRTSPVPALAEQAPRLLEQVAGYVGHRTIAIGLRCGLLQGLADRPGTSAEELADVLDLDHFYASVWCRSALAAGVVDRAGDGYRLAAQMATLLLDRSSPAYLGELFLLCEAPEMFGRFEAGLATGERTWWDDASPQWLARVAGAGSAFYTRLVPAGLSLVPGLAERLSHGCRVVDAACGAGAGLVRLARSYPGCEVIGVDGDRRSLDAAQARLREAGVSDRVQLVCSALEDLALDAPVALVVNNLSMHECRDLERVTYNVRAALEPGGWFVISDLPFPDTDAGLRTAPGRVMCGLQFFEAQIDDQLLPRAAYDRLLARHGFTDIGSAPLTPLHALTHARTPTGADGHH